MPSSAKSIKAIYDDGMLEVFRVVTSLKATPAQIKIARQTAKDLTTLLVAHTLDSIEGRTALLSGLIVELNAVIKSIRAKSPYAGALDKFTRIVTRAQTLFDQEKKELV